ncbi:MAG: radical SAM protein [Bacteroidota bacterium]
MTAKLNDNNDKFLSVLEKCSICPRECHVNRVKGGMGYCMSGAGFNISSIFLHMGEEPVISGKNGICNVFFSHCNLQCVYCQNYQISRNTCCLPDTEMSLEKSVNEICKILDSGTNLLGFVSPSHCIPQMKTIIEKLHTIDRNPVVVYNSNAYDKVETLKYIEGLIDVYLPDFKYSDKNLAFELSDVPDYPETAFSAIKEMVRQKGTSVRLNNEGQAGSGVIVRHLVLPGHVENSVNALKMLAEEISPLLHISLMSQYYPTPAAKKIKGIDKKASADEYQKVVDALEHYGFHRGWVQDAESSGYYKPDFQEEHPFFDK